MFNFHKYQGTGNDFILIDDRERKFPSEDEEVIAKLCDRHFGIGADGLILLQKDEETAFYMDYFNSDGRRSSMCGNGGRCLVHFAHSLGIFEKSTEFMAVDGTHKAEITEMGVKLQMVESTEFEKLGGSDYFINTGSPHFVRILDEPIDELNVYKEGRLIRYSPRWHRQGTNVNFVFEDEDGTLFVRTYERGVEDETLSCGTGVTAAAEVFGKLNPGEDKPTAIRTLGGNIQVHVGKGKRPWLEGPATSVFKGSIEIPHE